MPIRSNNKARQQGRTCYESFVPKYTRPRRGERVTIPLRDEKEKSYSAISEIHFRTPPSRAFVFADRNSPANRYFKASTSVSFRTTALVFATYEQGVGENRVTYVLEPPWTLGEGIFTGYSTCIARWFAIHIGTRLARTSRSYRS